MQIVVGAETTPTRSNTHLMTEKIIARGYSKPVELIVGEKWTVEGKQTNECYWEFKMTPEIKEEIMECGGDINKWIDESHVDFWPPDHFHVNSEYRLRFEPNKEDYAEYEWSRIVPQKQIMGK